jgi:hypothetical protein
MRWIPAFLTLFWPSGIYVGGAMQLRPGVWVDVPLPGPALGVCDDTNVARVVDAWNVLRVVGVAPGRTLCGFHSRVRGLFPPRVYDVQVTEP